MSFGTDIGELLMSVKDTLVGLELAAPFHKFGRPKRLRSFLEKNGFALERVSLNCRVNMPWRGYGPAQRATFLTHSEATELKVTIDEATFESLMETGLCTLPKLDRIFFINGRIPTMIRGQQGRTSFDIMKKFDTVPIACDEYIFSTGQRLPKNGKVRLLRYVGFGIHIFVCNLLQPGTQIAMAWILSPSLIAKAIQLPRRNITRSKSCH